MKRIFKLTAFAGTTIIFLGGVFFIRAVHFLVLRDSQWILPRLTKQWARVMIWILHIKITCGYEQSNIMSDHYLSVSNHQSYLDVIVIASQMPSLFVAKKDVQSWPIIGWLSSLGGTLYIDRKAFRGSKHSVVEIEQALCRNINVHIFPEGTSNNGESIFPFRSSLFTAACSTNNSILPISVNYERIDHIPVDKSNRDMVCWYGDMTFPDHFWQVLGIDSIDVSLVIHPPFSTMNFETSKEVSMAAYNFVSTGFNRLH